MSDLQKAVDHFCAEPWTRALIEAPGTRAFVAASRRPRTGEGVESQDELFRTSLNSTGGVPAMLVLHPEPDTSPSAPGPVSIPSASLLLDLQDGVRGFNGFVHGGFLAAATDEAMGALILANYEYQLAAVAKDPHWTPPPAVLDMNMGVRVLTASMNVAFRRPVSTPGFVVVTATMTRIEGRKIFLRVTVADAAAHSKGLACTTCDGMWVIVGQEPKSKM